MKNLGFLFLVAVLSLGVVSCGNKDKGSSSTNRFSSDPYRASTVEGYLDASQPFAYVGNDTYTISQNSFQAIGQAFQQAQQQGIQPVNGRFKARITGSVQATNQQQQYPQNPQYPQQTGNVLNVTSAVVHN